MNSTRRGQALNSRQRKKRRKHFALIPPGSGAHRGLSWLHCGLLIRITWMTSGTFPGQRKFPVSLFKGSQGPAQENRVSGREAQASLLMGRRGRVRLVVEWGAAKRLVSTSVPNFIWGTLAWLEVKKGSLQFMAFPGGWSGRHHGLGELKAPFVHNVVH